MLQTNAQTIGTSMRATQSENVFLTYTVPEIVWEDKPSLGKVL